MRTWSEDNAPPQKRDCLSHHEVLTRLDGYDPARGTKIVGHRGYCLTGYGVFLNLALIQYGLEFLHGKGYTPNQPPFFMNREAMAKTAQLEQFDEELYKVTEDDNKANDKYLIATSEQPLSCLHESEWLQDAQLPIKYVPLLEVEDALTTLNPDTQATAHVSEKKQAPTAKTLGVSSASINSKRYALFQLRLRLRPQH